MENVQQSTNNTGKGESIKDVAPAVTVIICSRNRADQLQKTLSSLSKTRIPDNYIIDFLLVNNGSSDETSTIMEQFQSPEVAVRTVREERPGISHARNRAIRESCGDILLFSDDDVRFPPDWIEKMVLPIVENRADAVAGAVKLAGNLERDWMTVLHRSWLASTEDIDPINPSRFVGANMAIRRGVLERFGGFEPELGTGALGTAEETFLAKRMRDAGLRIVSAFDVMVEHHPETSRLLRSAYIDMAQKMGRSDAYIEYHWEGKKYSKISLYYIITKHYFRLILKRWWRFHQRKSEEGAPVWELLIIKEIYFYKQYIIEQTRKPKFC